MSAKNKKVPLVTGISPIEGAPGTKITIRGENLGQSSSDLIGLTICGFDCLLLAEWKTPNKIIARSGPNKGSGLIIVTTKSGGKGSSTVQFRCKHEKVGLLTESAVWVEDPPVSFSWGRSFQVVSNMKQDDPLGLSSEENEKVVTAEDLNEMYPQKNGDIMSANYSPEWFLLENHSNASFNDLKAGYAFLKRKIDLQKEGELSFLKSNILSIIEQMDTLLSLRGQFARDFDGTGQQQLKQPQQPQPIHRLNEIIEKSIKTAEKFTNSS